MICPHRFRYEPPCGDCQAVCKLGKAEPRESLYARIHREAGTVPKKKRGEEKES